MKRNKILNLFCISMYLLFLLSACGNLSNRSSSINLSESGHSSKTKSKNDIFQKTPTSKSSPPSDNKSQNSPPSDNSTSMLKHSEDVKFNTTMEQAMQVVQKNSKMSLMAPTEPLFMPNVKYIGARVDASANSYNVLLSSTESQLPINSSTLSSPEYEQAITIIGSFGAVEYPSSMKAKDFLFLSSAQSIAPAYQPAPKLPATKVNLGNGIVGEAYNNPTSNSVVGAPMVEWHEGNWTLQVWDGPLNQDIQEAKNIVGYLNIHLLPETYGVFGENIAGDGNHTTVEWVYGNTIYSCFSYHSGLKAVEMAASSRVYPSGQIKP